MDIVKLLREAAQYVNANGSSCMQPLLAISLESAADELEKAVPVAWDGSICPIDSLPCEKRREAISGVVNALSYGLAHSFISHPQLPARPEGGVLELEIALRCLENHDMLEEADTLRGRAAPTSAGRE